MTTVQGHGKKTWRESLYVPEPAKDWALNVVATRINSYDGYRAFVTRSALACGMAAIFGWYLLTAPDPNWWSGLAVVPILVSLTQGILEIFGEWYGRRHELRRSPAHGVFGDSVWRRSYLINLTGLIGVLACPLNILAVTFLLPADLGLIKILALVLAMLYLNSGLGAVLIDAPLYNQEEGNLAWQLLCMSRPFIGIGLGVIIAVVQVGLFQVWLFQLLPALWARPWPTEPDAPVLVALVSLLPIALSLRVLENERVLSAAHDMMVRETVHDLRETARWISRKLDKQIDRIEEKLEAGESPEEIGKAIRALREAGEELVGKVTSGNTPAAFPAEEILGPTIDELRKKHGTWEFRDTVLVQAIHEEDHRIARDLLRSLCQRLDSRFGNFIVELGQQMNNEVDEYVRFELTVSNTNYRNRVRVLDTIAKRLARKKLANLNRANRHKRARAEVVKIPVDKDRTTWALAIKVSWVIRKVWL